MQGWVWGGNVWKEADATSPVRLFAYVCNSAWNARGLVPLSKNMECAEFSCSLEKQTTSESDPEGESRRCIWLRRVVQNEPSKRFVKNQFNGRILLLNSCFERKVYSLD